MNFKDESHKSPDQLEREIDMRRSHIVDTLDELGNRLSPRHIIDETSDYIRGNAGVFSRNLSSAVSNNPGPVLLTAAGLVWMLASLRNRQHTRDSFDDSHDYYGEYDVERYGEYDYEMLDEYSDPGILDLDESIGLSTSAEAAGENSGDGIANKARHKLDSAREKARQKAAHMRHKTRDGKQAMRAQSRRIASDFEDLVNRQPLVAGAIGLGLGALIAASFAPTRTEDRLMGPARNKVKDQATTMAKDAGEQAEARARATADKVKEDIKRAVRQDAPPVSA